MEELLQGTAEGQQRLEEADRRTRDTAGERAAKRIKFPFADRPFDPTSSSSASPSDAIAGRGDAASAGSVVAAGVAQHAAQDTLMSGVTDGRRTSPREGDRMTRSEGNDSARRRQNWRWKCQMWRRSRTTEESWTCDVTVGKQRTSTTVTQRCTALVNCDPG